MTEEGGEGITLWFLIELVAAGLVAYLAVEVSLGYAQGTIYEKLNVAKDIAMQINTMQALQGDGFLVSDLHGYSVKIAGNKIEVFAEDSDLVKGTYYFVKPKDLNMDFRLENSEKLQKHMVISKSGSRITIAERAQT